MTFPLLPLTRAFSTYTVSVGIALEVQVEPRNSGASLRTLDGKLLPSPAVLRPLRLLPLSTLQHHLSLLEDEPPLLKEDLDAARTFMHMHANTYIVDDKRARKDSHLLCGFVCTNVVKRLNFKIKSKHFEKCFWYYVRHLFVFIQEFFCLQWKKNTDRNLCTVLKYLKTLYVCIKRDGWRAFSCM